MKTEPLYQLREVEARLKSEGYRGHVYVTPGGPVVLTTAQRQRAASRMIGPQRTREAIRRAVGIKPEEWAAGLVAGRRRSECPAPIVWNTVHLVVTGTSHTLALLTALQHANEHESGTLRTLEAGTGLTRDALTQAFEQATGATLPPEAWSGAAEESRRSPTDSPAASGPPSTAGTEQTILTGLAEEARKDPEERSTLRIMMRGIARTWRGLDADERRRTLAVPPPLSGTRWDALLAAVTEHVAWRNGHPKPGWTDEAGRFNDPPHSYSVIEKENAICWCPAAFLRHGALADPRDLDVRGETNGDWIPRA